MYIRKHNRLNKKSGKYYTYYSIVQSERIGSTIHQKTVLTLGSDFIVPEEKWLMLCKKIERAISGENVLFESSFNQYYDALAKTLADQIIAKRSEEIERIEQLKEMDLNKSVRYEVEFEHFRSAGVEHVALNGVERLGLTNIFTSLGFDAEKAKLAVAAVVARMAHPSSERETLRWLDQNSSLCELLDLELPSEYSLYKISDDIYNVKDLIESKMSINITNIFNAQPIIAFYDLTNTYFEGNPGINKAKRGHSKEKRTDCPLITLAVVLDSYGFVIRSEIFSGNVSEPGTMGVMLEKLNAKKIGKVVMDRGIATADNIQWLNQKGYSYVVVNREQKRIFDFDKASPIKAKSGDEIQIYKEMSKDGTEVRLYCYSENKKLKESSIWLRKAEKFEMEIAKIDEGLTRPRCQKDKSAIERRIGRLFEKYSGISQHYSIKVDDNSQVKDKKGPLLATKIILTKNPVSGSMMEQPGVYCLRSNDLTMSPEDMWLTYSRLTDIESVFRSLKSELGLRPIYHRKPDRVESHLFITVLAYQCVQIIRSILKSAGIRDSWWSIRECLASHGRVSATLSGEDGSFELIRKSIKPESWQETIYRTLRISKMPGRVYTISKKLTK
jgi:hypothetical protein